jgi:hypothetical protein
MSVSVGIAIAEAQSLRGEITARITLMNAVIALELATLGTGLAVIGKPTYLLAALGAASSFLWLQWLEHSTYTYKIAAYLAVELAPALSRLTGHPVLGWEEFLRRIEGNGEESRRALYPGPGVRGRRLVYSGRHGEWYTSLLFAITPPLLQVLYVVDTRDSLVRVLPACLAAGLMWVYTLVRYVLHMRDIKVINQAIGLSRTSQMTTP